MGLMQWLGFNRPRDEPGQTKLPEVTDNVRGSGGLFIFGTADSGERVDERSAMQIATVYACVRLLAETVAQLPLRLYREKDGGRGKERAVEHPLYKILYRQTNPEMSAFSFREAMMTHLLLWGNSYSQIVRDGKNQILGLYPLLPENVEIDRDEHGELFYIYHAYTDEKPGETGRDIYFKRDEILHIPGLGFNGLVGFSPIAMMKNSLGTTLAVEKYGSSFFRNGAQPSGVLEHPGILKDPQKIRDNWSAVYGGANNAHKVAVLEEGMAYKPISLPPEDSQFLSTREFGVEEICRIFRVPPHMVQSLKRATFSNIEHQSLDYTIYTLTPWLVRIEQAIIKDLLLEEEKDLLFPKFNVDGLLRGDYESRMRGYATGFSNGFLTVNDICRLEDMDFVSEENGGDFHVVNGSYVQLKDVGAAYAQQMQQTEEREELPEPQTDKESDEDENEGEGERQAGNRKTAHEQRHEQRKKQRR